MLISRARLPPKPLKRAKDFVDLDGFKDIRYVMIVFGSFLVNFGLYTPHYFSGEFYKFAFALLCHQVITIEQSHTLSSLESLPLFILIYYRS